jgi:hypothetical protein
MPTVTRDGGSETPDQLYTSQTVMMTVRFVVAAIIHSSQAMKQGSAIGCKFSPLAKNS